MEESFDIKPLASVLVIPRTWCGLGVSESLFLRRDLTPVCLSVTSDIFTADWTSGFSRHFLVWNDQGMA